MAAIILPRRHYTQPQGRVEVAPEWIERGLMRAWLPNNGGGVELFSNRPPIANTLANGVGAGGITALGSGGEAASFAISDSFETGEFTILAVISPANVTQTNSAIGGLGSTASNNQILYLVQEGAELGFYFRNNANSGVVNTPEHRSVGLGLTANVPQCVGLSSRDAAHAYAINGVEIIERTSPGGSGLLTVNRLGICAMVRASNALFWDGAISFAAIGNKKISKGELESATNNPWQIFRADPVRIYSLPPVITIPTLSSPGVIDITANSARPQVTLTY